MIRALPEEAPGIVAFLSRAPERAMFPLSNLRAYGMQGGHPRVMRFWLRRAAGQITDVLGVTESGMIFPAIDPARTVLAGPAFSGLSPTGIAGPMDQSRALEAALGLKTAPKTLDHDEPHFALDLDRLTLPTGPGALCPMQDAPRAIICDWMSDYHLNTLHTPPEQVPGRVESWYKEAIETRSHLVLMQDGAPFAMTGFNARLPKIVQIGGVYTPPPLRGRGHARRAVALHLAHARASGAQSATLFSASPAAARAYQSIGFERIGAWSLILFLKPHEAP